MIKKHSFLSKESRDPFRPVSRNKTDHVVASVDLLPLGVVLGANDFDVH